MSIKNQSNNNGKYAELIRQPTEKDATARRRSLSPFTPPSPDSLLSKIPPLAAQTARFLCTRCRLVSWSRGSRRVLPLSCRASSLLNHMESTELEGAEDVLNGVIEGVVEMRS